MTTKLEFIRTKYITEDGAKNYKFSDEWFSQSFTIAP